MFHAAIPTGCELLCYGSHSLNLRLVLRAWAGQTLQQNNLTLPQNEKAAFATRTCIEGYDRVRCIRGGQCQLARTDGCLGLRHMGRWVGL